MDNQIKIFENNEYGTIRTTVRDGEPWFVAADVCKILGLEQVSRAMSRLDEDEKGLLKVTHPQNPNKVMDVNGVNEAGLYHLILCSNKPGAKAFKRWITHDVIPTIRKTGGYVANAEAFIENYLPMADENTKQLFRLTLNTVDQLNHKIREQNEQIERDAPEVDFAKRISKAPDTYSIGYLAKFSNANGYSTGKIRFFDQLRRDGYLGRTGSNYNQPMQKYCDSGLFVVQMSKINMGDMEKFMPTTKVTGKGIKYFFRHYCARGVKVSDNEIDMIFGEFSATESDCA